MEPITGFRLVNLDGNKNGKVCPAVYQKYVAHLVRVTHIVINAYDGVIIKV